MGITLSCSGGLSRFNTFEKIINTAVDYLSAAGCIFDEKEAQDLGTLLVRARKSYNSVNKSYPWVVTNKVQWFFRTKNVLPFAITVQEIYAQSNDDVPNTVPFDTLTTEEKINVAAVYFVLSFIFNYDETDNGLLSANNNKILQFYVRRAGTTAADGDVLAGILSGLSKIRFGNGNRLALANNTLVSFSAPMFLMRGRLQQVVPQTGNCNYGGNNPSAFGQVIPAGPSGVIIRGGTYIARASASEGCALVLGQDEGFAPSQILQLLGVSRPFRGQERRKYLQSNAMVPSSVSFDSSDSCSEEELSEDYDSEQEYLDPRITPQYVGDACYKGHKSSCSSSSDEKGRMLPGTVFNYLAEILTEIRLLRYQVRTRRLRRIIRNEINALNSNTGFVQPACGNGL
jgi:hypothetical protein